MYGREFIAEGSVVLGGVTVDSDQGVDTLWYVCGRGETSFESVEMTYEGRPGKWNYHQAQRPILPIREQHENPSESIVLGNSLKLPSLLSVFWKSDSGQLLFMGLRTQTHSPQTQDGFWKQAASEPTGWSGAMGPV